MDINPILCPFSTRKFMIGPEQGELEVQTKIRDFLADLKKKSHKHGPSNALFPRYRALKFEFFRVSFIYSICSSQDIRLSFS